MSHAGIRELFARHAGRADFALIEGNKGLHDGVARDGSNSNAALARLLNAPVVLVIDTRGVTRGVAPLVLGYQAFDPGVSIRGVILNQVAGARHEAKLRDALEYYTDVEVLGAVHRSSELEIGERHLGLVPNNEVGEAASVVRRIAAAVAAQVDLAALLRIGRAANPLPAVEGQPGVAPAAQARIGVARDSAFGFYYADDLEELVAAGAELVPFDTLRDWGLPEVDALFIGGGFPETHMAQLEANRSMRQAIRDAIDSGMPAYAECGGLMYLARSIRWADARAEMVGAIPGDVVMNARPQGRGYVRLQETAAAPWPTVGGQPARFSAHEFHYSRLENLASDAVFAYEVLRGTGIDGAHDGIVYKNLLASYVHLRSTAENRWPERFVDFVRRKRNRGLQVG
jgi:cobyrinic acid a,c-diamide synthase